MKKEVATMLYGTYEHSIDKKGRVAIPVKLRGELGNEFMVSRGIYGQSCLEIYSLEEWERVEEKIRQMPSTKSIKLKRFLFGGCSRVELDSQGRILIPSKLREYAKLDSEALFIAVGSNLELWDPTLWEQEESEYTPESMAELSAGLDF